MKTKILRQLRTTNEYVSGQMLCDELGVSRTAVWKAINQLKEEGYTIEAIIKVPYNVSAWSSVFGQKGTGKLAGMQGGEPESNGGLNISGSRELQWNPWTTNNAEIKDNPTTWSDAGGIQPDKWHHIVIKNNGHSTVMIVDGIQVQRCNTFQKQVGIQSLNVGGEKGWVVGTAYWSEAENFSESACGDAIFKGSIQEIRMSRGVIDQSIWYRSMWWMIVTTLLEIMIHTKIWQERIIIRL